MVKNPTKRQRKNKPTSKKYKFYKIDGDKITRERHCPRCGLGIFLMKASDRTYCGKCHLTEFISKKDISEKKADETKEK
jgi:small subunit ribosomal protein S27Ae